MSVARFLSPFIVAIGLELTAQAQDVRNLSVFHQEGQTFVTWTELFDQSMRYRVYRDTKAMRSFADLQGAEFLGEVGSDSSYNLGRSLATNRDYTWIIREGDKALSAFAGLFVNTVMSDAVDAYYAVTSVSAGGTENTLVKRGRNSLHRGLSETMAPTQPVLQNIDGTGELWAHWVTNRGTPYEEALSLKPSHGFNFRFDAGGLPGPRGLAIRLHSAGETFPQGWPHRNEVQGDIDILAISDLLPESLWTLWFGYHEKLPGPAANDTMIHLFTQKRVVWTLDWMQSKLGAAHDKERVYAVGGSMGAMGSIFLAGEIPERLAAVLCRNANFDLAAPDIANPWFVQDLLGTFSQNLKLPSGLAVYDRANASFMATANIGQDWPIVRTLNGRNDETVGWMATRNFYDAMKLAYRPAVHYFDDHIHGPHGYWYPLHDTLLRRTFAERLSRPTLRFSDFSLDQKYGDGQRLNGDLIGSVNGYVDYDPLTVQREPLGIVFDVALRGGIVLDAATAEVGTVRMTPRRTGQPALEQGMLVHYTLREGEVLKDEHILIADEFGLVHTPPAPVTHTSRSARFDMWFPPSLPYLFLGRAPIAPGELQTMLFGLPGVPFEIAYSIDEIAGRPKGGKRERGGTLGDSDSDDALLQGDAILRLEGTIPQAGYVDLTVPVRDLPGIDGFHIYAQARIDGQVTPVRDVTIRASGP